MPPGVGSLGITGSMVFPNEESCAMKYPKLVLAAASSADLWLAESSCELGELGSCCRTATGVAGPDDAATATEEEEEEAADAVEVELPLFKYKYRHLY